MPMTNKTFARGAIILMSAGLLALLAIVATSVWLAGRTSQLAADVLNARADRTLTRQLTETLINAETGQRGYMLTGSPRYLAPFDAARAELPGELARVSRLSGAALASRQDVERLAFLTRAKMNELADTIDLTRAGKRDEAMAILRSDHGQKLMEEARGILGRVTVAAENLVVSDVSQMNENAQRLRVVTLLGGALIVLFGFSAFWLALRYMRELNEAQRELESLNTGLELRVAERTSALTRANEEIQRFAYIVSHDLRAPLVNIMGFTSELEVSADVLQRYLASDEPDASLEQEVRTAANADIPESVRFIRSSTVKMDGLINAILKLSREGRRELRAEPIDLRQLFDTAATTLRHQLDEAGAEIALSGRFTTVVSDRLALEQVFGNLLDNAVKYLSPGRPGRIAVKVREDGQSFVVRIEDNGRGIAEQDQERIFELFRRAGTQDKAGEGIGLAHVRALVRRLGGDITVESRLGEGSTFRVVLPKLFSLQPSRTS